MQARPKVLRSDWPSNTQGKAKRFYILNGANKVNDPAGELALEDHIELSQRTAKIIPKLVEILRDLPHPYRQRAVDAAMVLLQDVTS